ncbi:M23 family metallopeptidase [Alkalihalobacterium alkalinitrilicum]|uniref:M23 family metallopeptidase n=1 Tax=Alkalihalobacterium alkalinitrilicum TaxID=427920 RepID=UPI00099510B2|nr:M23 family metallopeptidase [Alkalihalobacterium alkalinitrilicum]
MKKINIYSLFFLLLFVTGCQSDNRDIGENNTLEKTSYSVDLPMKLTENEARFSVNDLIAITDGSYDYDEIHRTLQMTINDDQFYLIEGVPVLERNGEYVANSDIYLIIENDIPYLPSAFLEIGLGLEVNYAKEVVSFEWYGPIEKVGGPPSDFNFDSWDSEQMIEYLSFLKKPIKEAEVSTIPGHLPGAKRPYRNGYHEGLDWYDFASGGDINFDTPIYGMANGTVVRADHDYEEYSSPEVRNMDLQFTSNLGETPEYIFDKLRGRQVWVQYPNGVMSRFAHLSDIPEEIRVGQTVDENTIIGYVGNSGTSGAVNQDSTELHLHQDLLIYGELFWRPLDQDQVVSVLKSIFKD